jgi:hypothetical protein
LGGSVSPLAGTPVSPLAGAENGCLALSVGLPLSSCVARIESRSVTGVPAIRQAEYSSHDDQRASLAGGKLSGEKTICLVVA